MNANREIVRLKIITRSPIVAFFTESMQGLPSIRSYDVGKQFFDVNIIIIKIIEIYI